MCGDGRLGSSGGTPVSTCKQLGYTRTGRRGAVGGAGRACWQVSPRRVYLTVTLEWLATTRSKNSSTSALCMRMQPSDALVPMLSGSMVPWMP